MPLVDSDANILIAYFSRVGNTDFPDGVDAITSASLLVKDGELYGNTQYIATLIQQQTDGELFLIQTEERYPADYDETDRQGQQENRDRVRPALASHVENMDEYDVIFLGFPNWYYDMPMAVYSFLEEYDLAGKTIVPFVTSGGSGFSNSIAEIQNIQPDAEVLTDGYKVSHVYKTDAFLEVTDEVQAVFLADERAEAAYERKMYRYKAQYSLDCENGIENAVLRKPQTPEMLLEEKQLREQLYSAVMTLPKKQARRIYARYYLGMTVNEIAGTEGVDPSRVRDSIRRGLKRLAKYF